MKNGLYDETFDEIAKHLECFRDLLNASDNATNKLCEALIIACEALCNLNYTRLSPEKLYKQLMQEAEAKLKGENRWHE